MNKNIKILIVDIQQPMRKIIKATLYSFGFRNIEEAEDGFAAWKKFYEADAQNQPFQLVISDWVMPKMNGLDFLKKIRFNPRYKDLPFLLVTTENDTSKVTEAVKSGISNLLIKPFSVETFKKKLNSLKII